MKTLLFIKPGSLGDVIHALPCAHALASALPHVQLQWLIDPRWAPLLEPLPFIHQLVLFPREQFRGWKGGWRALQWLAQQRPERSVHRPCTAGVHPIRATSPQNPPPLAAPEIAVDLQGLFRSAWIARNSGALHRLGLSDAREGARFFYTQTAAVTNQQHAVDRYLQVLPLVGQIWGQEIAIPDTPCFAFGEGEPCVLPAIQQLAPDEPWIVLHPFARGKNKSLLPWQIEFLIQKLAPLRVLLVGQGEVLPDLPSNGCSLMGQTTLPQLLWLLKQAEVTLSVDSGPMHLAAAVGRKVLSIHTWSHPQRVGPYVGPDSKNAWIWQGGKLRVQDLKASAGVLPAKAVDRKALEEIAEWVKEGVQGFTQWKEVSAK